MQSGSLAHRVTLQARTSRVDDYGNVLDAWADVAGLVRVSASAVPQSGREAIAAGAPQSTVRMTLRLRASAASRAITAAHRVAFATGPYAGRIAAIEAVIPSSDSSFVELVADLGAPT